MVARGYIYLYRLFGKYFSADKLTRLALENLVVHDYATTWSNDCYDGNLVFPGLVFATSMRPPSSDRLPEPRWKNESRLVPMSLYMLRSHKQVSNTSSVT